MDRLFIEAIMNELREQLVGARISKIHQPSPETLIFKLWTGRETHHLLVSAAPGRSRIHLTRFSYPNPPAPARFCQLLRARLSRLLALEQVPGDRIVRLDFSAVDSTPDPSGCQSRLTLIAELTPRHGNLILLDGQGRIIDALKRRGDEEEGRAVLPGGEYQPLPWSGGQLLAEDAIVPPQVLTGKEFESWLLREIRPMSRLMAKDLASRVDGGASPQNALEDFRRARENREYQFFTAMFDGREVLSAYDLGALKVEKAAHFPTPSLAADAFFGKPGEQSDGMDQRRQLQTVVRKQLKRLGSRRSRIEEEQEASNRAEELRQAGELLLGQLYRLRPGMTTVALENYYADPPTPLTLSLEPRLTPQENAEKYFHQYKKLKRSREHLARRLLETEEERDWLEGVALALEEAENAEELAEIRRELVEARLLQAAPRASGSRGGSDPGRKVREAITPSGYRLYWGTGNRVNDHVSRHLCKAEDLWFHALNLPGCHLVLKRDQGGEVPVADQLFAAALAAGYSRGKNEGKVEVMVTEGKWVKKPKGARPGLVTVKQYRTLLVVPRRME
jgi:predicted ribosome quality control (RQC) complex YloA/Tae2 family protein